jgi:hypothetical protein
MESLSHCGWLRYVFCDGQALEQIYLTTMGLMLY